MTPTALIPVKPPADGKSRLSGRLSDTDRHALNQRLFEHVFETTAAVIGHENILVVSRDDPVLNFSDDAGARGIREPDGAGLNDALTAALPGAADLVLVLHADLPLLETDDVEAMIGAADQSGLVIAPDRHGQGTNAMLLRPPGLIPFRFGAASFQAHRALAEEAGITPHVIDREGLAFDLDTPADYLDLTRRGIPF